MASAASTPERADNKLSQILTTTIAASVRSDNAVPSFRWLAMFLKTYMERDIEQTVHGSDAALNILKPAITRSLDRLSAFGFIEREHDRIDRRSVLVRKTSAGAAHLRGLFKHFAVANRT